MCDTQNDTIKLYNNLDFTKLDETSAKSMYDKLDTYKTQIVTLTKQLKAHDKIINEQRNKIRLLESKNLELIEEIHNNNNIITIQNEIINKSRNINDKLYNHIKKDYE